MQKLDPTELVSGLLMLLIGMYFFLVSQSYPMGTIQRMGPGYVPHILGAVIMVLGLVIATGARKPRFPVSPIAWRPVIAVLGSIFGFAVLLPRTGLVPAVFFSSVLAMLGNRDADAKLIALTSVAISFICWLLFIALLRLPLQALWFEI